MAERDSIDDTAIALIGMSGRFPGAPDIETFWHNIAQGVKSIRFFSDEDLLKVGVSEETLRQPGYVRAGALLDNIDLFDAEFFGYAPRDAQVTDPQQRLFLECAWEALESAGYSPQRSRGLIGVFAGSGFSTYMLNNLYANPALEGLVDPLQIAIGNDRDALASTVSYKLNLKGPSISVQTFCSTSLVAVHLACQSLLNYECDMALAGGVAIQVPHTGGYVYKEGGIVSPDGECRTFDAQAQGSVMGNGVGVVTLKRLSEALEDGDYIYAILRGSAVNNDGNMRVSYAAPGLDGQTEVIAEAIGQANIPVKSISYIEAHGTATMLGDAVELAAMKKAFALSTHKKQFCALGSVKPNLGHLDRASGVTGLVKTALALRHRLLPPSLNFVSASTDVALEQSPFYVNTQACPWPATEGPRRAGVSSFGLGGTNAHVILEEAPATEPSGVSRPWQLLTLSARTASAAGAINARLCSFLEQHPQASLPDVAYTLNVGRNTFNHRQFVVGRSRQEIIKALKNSPFSQCQTFRERGVAFLFPDVGEQYLGMAQELYAQEDTFRQQIDHGCHFLRTHQGLDLASLVFSPSSDARQPELAHRRTTLSEWGRSQPRVSSAEQIKQPSIALPVAFLTEYALAQLFISWRIQPEAMLGYGVGEYVAACLAGVLSLEDALTVVTRSANLIQETEPGAMMLVSLSPEAAGQFLDEEIELVAVNSPHLCVLAGPEEAVELLEDRLTAQGVAYRRIDTPRALHSSLLAPLREDIISLLSEMTLRPPKIPYISNVSGTWITPEQATAPTYWAEQICSPVLFSAGVNCLLRETEHVLLEIGVGQELSSFARHDPTCTDARADLIVATLPGAQERQSEQKSLLTALGKLWLAGVTLDWQKLYASEQRRRIPLPTYPFERQRYWIDPPQWRTLMPYISTPASADNSAAGAGKRADPASWFYTPDWQEIPLAHEDKPAPESQRPWLIFLDEKKAVSKIAQHMHQLGRPVICVQAGTCFMCLSEDLYSIRPGEPADYLALCKALAQRDRLPGTILHAWSLHTFASASFAERFELAQEYGLYSLIYLVQALGAQMHTDPIQILVVSRQLHLVSGNEPLIPEQATILSACKVIPQEYLNILCRNLDFDNLETAEFLDRLLAESQSIGADLIVAYRGSQRLVQTYRQLPLQRSVRPVFRQQGVYLLTGGLGNIGLVLAEYLAREMHARLVLLSRSVPPERATWDAWLEDHPTEEHTSVLIRRIRAIESFGGEVLILQADVADPVQLRRVLAQTRAHFGTLHGIFHAAGISSEAAFRVIQEIGPAQCTLHFRPKAYGLYALEETLADMPLDFCLLYSSLASVLGGLGFAGYTAANIFLDSFADQHNLRAVTPWISVNWDTWQVKENAHSLLGATVEQYAMRPEEAIEALTRVLQSGRTRVVNSTGDLEARMQQWLRRQNTHEAAGFTSAYSGATQPRPQLSTPYTPAQEEYEQQMVLIWQQVLGIEPVGIHDNFFELGGHSLMGTQLIGRLRQTFRVNLPLAVLFEASTIAELALAIKLQLLEEIDRVDESAIEHFS